MRVLVVEDVRRLADDIAEGLRDQAMAVDVAYDGLVATSKLNLNQYDVVVLDRDLPGLHGDTICRMITELILRIRNLARRKPTAHARILRHHDVELDPLRRSVTRAGDQHDLSAKEFAVLEALMRAAPATLGSEALLAQVWDENADPFTKTVQVTLTRLRRKLGEPDIIETIRGVGYRITSPRTSPRARDT